MLKEYPKHREGHSQPRSFVTDWYKKYDWAEYSQERDAMFCYSCRYFSLPGFNSNGEEAFTKTGFRRWKKSHGKDGAIPKHTASQCHKRSDMAWKDYE